MPPPSSDPPRARATVVFFLVGAVYAAWATRIPLAELGSLSAALGLLIAASLVMALLAHPGLGARRE